MDNKKFDLTNRIACGTGHRPQDLPCKWDKMHPWKLNKINQLSNLLIEKPPAKIITGMALGWDSWLAYVALKLKIPLLCYVPFKGQESRWSDEQKKFYQKTLDLADSVRYICDEGYAPWKMQKRNEAMVNDSDVVLALWNPEKKYGGTFNCLSYALKCTKPVANLWFDGGVFYEIVGN
jgi:uncharacterized phage-like protein YoqJ